MSVLYSQNRNRIYTYRVEHYLHVGLHGKGNGP
jgi:hypothetical protein